ncbi:MAG: hypothetical protein WC663_03125 [Patescibacteria group bacterium]|jgi:hypothetical protein
MTTDTNELREFHNKYLEALKIVTAMLQQYENAVQTLLDQYPDILSIMTQSDWNYMVKQALLYGTHSQDFTGYKLPKKFFFQNQCLTIKPSLEISFETKDEDNEPSGFCTTKVTIKITSHPLNQ